MKSPSERLSRLSPVKRALLLRLLREEAISQSEIIPRRPTQHLAPLSFAQERLWFLDQLQPWSSMYNIQIGLRLKGSLNLSAVRRSLNEILRRHEALRTIFVPKEGRPVQIVTPFLPIFLQVIDLSARSESDREGLVLQLITEDAEKHFDLSRGPLMRAILMQLSGAEHILLLTTHHIVADGSIIELLQEFSVLYKAFSRQRASPLPEPSIQYGDFAYWQRQKTELFEANLSYWKRQLGPNLSALNFPRDRSPPVVRSFRGAREPFALPRIMSDSLRVLSRQEGVTFFMIVLAAFKTLLYRYTGQHDIVVGSPIADRPRIETEGLIGCFVNSIVLRTDFSGDPSFRELLGRVREMSLDAYAHKDLPFEMLVEALQPERYLSQTPLFQVMFAFQYSAPPTVDLPELAVSYLDVDSRTARFDLLFAVGERVDGLSGLVEFNTDIFDRTTITRMLGHFQTLLKSILENPEQRLASLPILTESERRLIAKSNDTNAPVREGLLHTAFETQVALRPLQPAVISGTVRLTYEELHRRSEWVGRKLRRFGACPNTLVAVVMEKGWEQVVGVLGVLQSGAAYLPLDPKLPKGRLRQLLDYGEVSLVVTQPSTNELLDWPDRIQRVCVRREEMISTEAPPLDSVQQARDLAYVIFTSGSTGLPKGVMIDHRAALNTVVDINQRFGVSATDRVLALSSLSFDLSVYDMFGMLAAGGTIIIPNTATLQNPADWAAIAVQEEITVWNSVPALLQLFVEYVMDHPDIVPRSLRLALVSGDSIPLTLPDRLKTLVPGAEVVSLGGATEASIWSTFYSIKVVDPAWRSIPYGRALTNQRVYVLSEALEPCPVGVPGELHIAGIGLARGYLKDEKQTSASFFGHPRTGERLYRTGDLGCYRPDGSIEFLGRLDHQVKIRGFRVELGEIEAALGQHPALRKAVVEAIEEASGDKRLVAYLVQKKEATPSAGELRSFLEEKLPKYMIPSAFVFLDALPLTPNGKVDRRCLPMFTPAPSDENEFVPPRNVLELQLTGIWEEILGVQPIGVRDDFFKLGGHSLLAARLIAKVRQALGHNLSLGSLFQVPTVEHQASTLRQKVTSIPWPHLIAMRCGSSECPFFCVHGAGGGVLYYLDLARHLGPNQTFFGIQATGVDSPEDPDVRIEVMASRYIEELCTMQPEGPYLLGGWSMGGTVAFEMAQQLQAQGKNVALLALLDTRVETPDVELAASDPTSLVSLFATEFANLFDEDLRSLTNCTPQVNLGQQLAEILRRAHTTNVVPSDLGLPEIRRLLRVFESHLRAMSAYVPRKYFGRVILFRATGHADGDIENFQDSALGWSELLGEGLRIFSVPGDHHTMLKKPNIEILAKQLRTVLEEALD